jgi:hypothetical protein
MAGITLRIDRVVFLIETFLAGFSGIDRAPLAPFEYLAHFDFLAGWGAFSPKNNGPDQRVPVISRAITDSVE